MDEQLIPEEATRDAESESEEKGEGQPMKPREGETTSVLVLEEESPETKSETVDSAPPTEVSEDNIKDEGTDDPKPEKGQMECEKLSLTEETEGSVVAVVADDEGAVEEVEGDEELNTSSLVLEDDNELSQEVEEMDEDAILGVSPVKNVIPVSSNEESPPPTQETEPSPPPTQDNPEPSLKIESTTWDEKPQIQDIEEKTKSELDTPEEQKEDEQKQLGEDDPIQPVTTGEMDEKNNDGEEKQKTEEVALPSDDSPPPTDETTTTPAPELSTTPPDTDSTTEQEQTPLVINEEDSRSPDMPKIGENTGKGEVVGEEGELVEQDSQEMETDSPVDGALQIAEPDLVENETEEMEVSVEEKRATVCDVPNKVPVGPGKQRRSENTLFPTTALKSLSASGGYGRHTLSPNVSPATATPSRSRPLLPKPPVTETTADVQTTTIGQQLHFQSTPTQRTVVALGIQNQPVVSTTSEGVEPVVEQPIRASDSPVSVVYSSDSRLPRMTTRISTSPPRETTTTGEDDDIEIVGSIPPPVANESAPPTSLEGTEWGAVKDPMLCLLKVRPTSPPPFHFTPPPSELDIPVPVGGYPCVDCGSVYAMKSLREFHLDRRVMKINVYCVACRSNLTFLNRCKYLEHIRRHAKERVGRQTHNTGGIYSSVQVSMLTPEEIDKNFEEWWTSPTLKRISDLCALYEYEFGSSLQINSIGEEVAKPIEKFDLLKNIRVRCTECSEEFGSAEELKRHFIYNLPPNHKQYICQICHAVYFSPCGNTAHQRTHRSKEEQRTPFTCAECGAQCKSSRDLATHLMNHRTIPTILNAWRCPKCFTFYSNWNTLVVHTASSHATHFYKCPRCPTAFSGVENFEAHRKANHGGMVGEKDVVAVPKCPQCDCMQQSKEELVEHLKTHLSNLAPFKVFRCPMCGRLLENKQGLVSHMGRSHSTHMRLADVQEIPFQFSDAEPTPAPTKDAKDKGKVDTTLPPPVTSASSPPRKRPPPMASGGSDAKRPPVQVDRVGGSRPIRNDPVTRSEQATSTAANLLPSIPPGLNVAGGIQCPFCPADRDPLPNEFMMRLHLKVKHQDKVNERLHEKSKAVSTNTPADTATTTPDVPAKKPRLSDTPTREGEKLSAGSFMCPECSTVFFSENSIKRHFLAAHRINDFEGYFMTKRHLIVQPRSESVSYICSVCKEGFPSPAALDSHSRQHGLHFIQRNKPSLDT